jgi:long-subunit acyl-CoA synthetase (AMP-forming)
MMCFVLCQGVNLTHKNLVSNIYGLKNLMSHDASKANVSLCFLPWSHVFGLVGSVAVALAVALPHSHAFFFSSPLSLSLSLMSQTCELHAFVAQGSAMALCPNREEILESLAIVKPTIMLSVPALLNRVSR